MTRSPDSLVSFAVGQPAVEKRDDKAFICWQEGEANLRAAIQNERRFSIVKSTSDYANSAGSFPGASLCPHGEACHDPAYSENGTESPGRCIGRWHAETDH